MGEIDLNIAINFIKGSSANPSVPATFDSISLIFFAGLVLLALVAFCSLIFFKSKRKKIFTIFTAAIAIFSVCFIGKAYAQNDEEWASSSINAYVNDDATISFDEGWLKNISQEDINIRYTAAVKSEEAELIHALDAAHLSIEYENGVFYEGNPSSPSSEPTWYSIDVDKSGMAAGQVSPLRFSLTNIDATQLEEACGKCIYCLKVRLWPKYHDIVFNASDGSFSDGSKTVTVAREDLTQQLEFPNENPVYDEDDYYFAGWFTEEEGCGKQYKPGDCLSDEFTTTLYAYYKGREKHKISLNKDGGSGGIDYIYEKYGDAFYKDKDCTQKITALSEADLPSRDHCTFTGYYLNETLCIGPSGAFQVDASYFTDDAELKAQWDFNVYKISFNKAEGEGGIDYIYEKYSLGFYRDEECTSKLEYLSVYDLPIKSFYNFNGYYLDNTEVIDRSGDFNVNAKFFTNDEDNVVVHWDAYVYKIDLNGNHGTPELQTIYEKYNDAFYYDANCENKITDNKISGDKLPARDNYSFGGFRLLNRQNYIIDQTGFIDLNPYDVTTNITLYASWVGEVYEVQLDDDTGSVVNLTTSIYEKYNSGFYESESCLSAERISHVNVPSKPHHIFKGYFDENDVQCINQNGDIIMKSSYVTEETAPCVLTAKWDEDVYEIELVSNTDQSQDFSIYEKFGQGFYSDAECKNKITEVAVPSKAFYQFKGYEDNQNTCISSDGIIQVAADYFEQNAELDAVWDANVFTIKIKKYGIEEPVNIYEKYETGFYSDEQCQTEISMIEPDSRDNYTFNCYYWRGFAITDVDGVIVCQNDFFKTSLTDDYVEAQWIPSVYEVKLKPNTSQAQDYSIYEKFGQGFYSDAECKNKITQVTPPVKDNYTFKGYTDGQTVCINNDGTFAVGTDHFVQDAELNATWDANVYTITLNNDDASATKLIYEKYDEGFYLDVNCTQKISSSDDVTDYYIKLPAPIEQKTCLGYSYNHNLVVKYDTEHLEENQGLMNCGNTTFVADSSINAFFQDVIFAITLNNTPSTTASTTIYERYGYGFYSDAACSNPITKVDIPVAPEHYAFNGYKFADQTVIDNEGNLPDDPTAFKEDCSIKADWLGEVYEITLKQDEATQKTVEKLYERYNDAFYTDEQCTTSVKQIDIPKKDNETFKGFFMSVVEGVEDKIIDEKGTILKDPVYFSGASEIYAVFIHNVFKVTLMADPQDKNPQYIYEKFNEGFYKDAQCTNLINWPYERCIPMKDALYCTGFYQSNAPVSVRYIDDKGALDKLTTTSFLEDTVLYAHWEERIISISFYSSQVANNDYTKWLYLKYNDDFYWDKACTKPFDMQITIPTKEHNSFRGYYDEDLGNQYFDKEGYRTSLLSKTSFRENTNLFAQWDVDVYKITLAFDVNGQLSEDVSTEFYVKYGVDFYNDSECTQPREFYDPFVMPTYSNRLCSGYYSDFTSDAWQYIDSSGTFVSSVSPSTWQQDTTIYAKIDFKVFTITFNSSSTKLETVPDPIYVKYGVGFFRNKECSPGNEITTLDKTPEYTGENKLFTGYYSGDIEFIDGLDATSKESLNKIIVDSSYINSDVELVPTYSSFICGNIIKDPGDTKRLDTSTEGQQVSIRLTKPDTYETETKVVDIVNTDTIAGYYKLDLDDSWANSNYVITYSNYGYGSHAIGQSPANIQLTATLGLDNYEFDELKTIADNIATLGSKSLYYPEFVRYIETDAVWYSHSCGLFDINLPSETSIYLDQKYKNNFETGSDEEYKDEVNQYLFLKIIGVYHDNISASLKTGITFQACRCLPKSYAFHNVPDLDNTKGWHNCDLRKALNEGNDSLYERICEPIRNTLNDTQKFTMRSDLQRMESSDKIFLLSYQELTTTGTTYADAPEQFSDGTEGTQYEWYRLNNIVGNNTNPNLGDQGFTNNGYSANEEPDLRWLRSPVASESATVFGIKYINDEGAYYSPHNVTRKTMINPVFTIGAESKESDNVHGSVKMIEHRFWDVADKLDGKSLDYKYTDSKGNTVEGKTLLRDFDSKESTMQFTIEGLPKNEPLDFYITTNHSGFFAEQEFQGVYAGQTETLKLTTVLSLDNYNLDELIWVAQHIAPLSELEREHDMWAREFQAYLDEGAIWYSHSCGRFDPSKPEETKKYLDPKYKNNFVTDSDTDSKNEINQYLFLRLIDFEHDVSSNNSNGDTQTNALFTFQAIHRLPKLYEYDSSQDVTNKINWDNSTLRYDMNHGEIYQGLNNEIKKYICEVEKSSQADRNPEPNKGLTKDKLFVLSYKEMYSDGSAIPNLDPWYYDDTEGYQYTWYKNNNIYGGDDDWEIFERNDILTGLGQLNNNKGSKQLWERTIGSHKSASDINRFMYINPNDSLGCTLYRNNATSSNKYGLCPCLCIGCDTSPSPEAESIVNVNVIKEAGSTGRPDVYDFSNIPVTYEYTSSSGSQVVFTDYTDDYGNCTLQHIPRYADNLDVYIKCEAGMGYFGDCSITVSAGNIYNEKVICELALDNYTFNELHIVSSDIQINHWASIYTKEFNNYLENDDVWYSHSCGRYNPDDPTDVTYLDSSYKCAFRDPSGREISDVNNYLFLRLLQVDSKDANNNDIGLTLQTVHCLPVLYYLADAPEEKADEVFWKGSKLDAYLQNDVIYTALSSNIKKELSYFNWSVDKSREETRVPSEQTENILRSVTIPSASELVEKYSLESEIFGVWNYKCLEGNRFTWYKNHSFDGTKSFYDEDIFNLSKCNDGNLVQTVGPDEDNTIMWTRTPYPMKNMTIGDKPKFMALKFTEQGSIDIRGWYESTIKGLIAPVFTL